MDIYNLPRNIGAGSSTPSNRLPAGWQKIYEQFEALGINEENLNNVLAHLEVALPPEDFDLVEKILQTPPEDWSDILDIPSQDWLNDTLEKIQDTIRDWEISIDNWRAKGTSDGLPTVDESGINIGSSTLEISNDEEEIEISGSVAGLKYDQNEQSILADRLNINGFFNTPEKQESFEASGENIVFSEGQNASIENVQATTSLDALRTLTAQEVDYNKETDSLDLRNAQFTGAFNDFGYTVNVEQFNAENIEDDIKATASGISGEIGNNDSLYGTFTAQDANLNKTQDGGSAKVNDLDVQGIYNESSFGINVKTAEGASIENHQTLSANELSAEIINKNISAQISMETLSAEKSSGDTAENIIGSAEIKNLNVLAQVNANIIAAQSERVEISSEATKQTILAQNFIGTVSGEDRQIGLSAENISGSADETNGSAQIQNLFATGNINANLFNLYSDLTEISTDEKSTSFSANNLLGNWSDQNNKVDLSTEALSGTTGELGNSAAINNLLASGNISEHIFNLQVEAAQATSTENTIGVSGNKIAGVWQQGENYVNGSLGNISANKSPGELNQITAGNLAIGDAIVSGKYANNIFGIQADLIQINFSEEYKNLSVQQLAGTLAQDKIQAGFAIESLNGNHSGDGFNGELLGLAVNFPNEQFKVDFALNSLQVAFNSNDNFKVKSSDWNFQATYGGNTFLGEIANFNISYEADSARLNVSGVNLQYNDDCSFRLGGLTISKSPENFSASISNLSGLFPNLDFGMGNGLTFELRNANISLSTDGLLRIGINDNITGIVDVGISPENFPSGLKDLEGISYADVKEFSVTVNNVSDLIGTALTISHAGLSKAMSALTSSWDFPLTVDNTMIAAFQNSEDDWINVMAAVGAMSSELTKQTNIFLNNYLTLNSKLWCDMRSGKAENFAARVYENNWFSIGAGTVLVEDMILHPAPGVNFEIDKTYTAQIGLGHKAFRLNIYAGFSEGWWSLGNNPENNSIKESSPYALLGAYGLSELIPADVASWLSWQHLPSIGASISSEFSLPFGLSVEAKADWTPQWTPNWNGENGAGSFIDNVNLANVTGDLHLHQDVGKTGLSVEANLSGNISYDDSKLSAELLAYRIGLNKMLGDFGQVGIGYSNENLVDLNLKFLF